MEPLLLGDLDNRGIVLKAICHDPGLEIQMCVHWTYTEDVHDKTTFAAANLVCCPLLRLFFRKTWRSTS